VITSHRTRTLLLLAALVAILAPTLALPLGPDSSMFFVSAQKILREGAVHYRDIVDVKPPLIYHLYAAVMLVGGESVLALRIADLIVQLATCLAIAALVRRLGGGDLWGMIAALIYAVCYGALGYAHTMQVESYLGLVVVGMAWLVLARRSRTATAAAGALAGVAALLKFPLAIVLVAVPLADMLIHRGSVVDVVRRTLLALGGFGAVLVLLVLYLVIGDATGGFAEIAEFIAGYARTKPRGPGALAAEITRLVPRQVVAGLSLTVVIGALGAVALSIVERRDASALRLVRFSIVVLALLVVSLVVEGKYYPYMLGRLHAPVAIAAAYGIVRAVRMLRRSDRADRLLAASLAAVALLFSPLAAWYWFSVAPIVARATGGAAAFDAYYDRMAIYYPRSELKEVGAFLAAHRADGGRVLVLSSIAALVHHHAGSVPDHRVYHSAFLLAPFAPEVWRAEMRRYAERRPEWIVVQRGDVHVELTGTTATSETLVDTLGLRLGGEYAEALQTQRFTVWRQRR
jgi:4-amino-4-deoxy-L-arabinose transferase-like glycosyltransferase